MRSFAASELQRNSAALQEAALMEPVFLTYHDKPRYVMMSLDAFVRMQGKEITAHLAAYPPAVATRIRELAKASLGVGPGPDASAVDKLVLATVNAPYKRSIDAATLRDCLAKADLDPWLVHVATFFTDVTPQLVLKFADQHGISRSKLAKAYLAMKQRTGERKPDLEVRLVPMAPSSQSNRRRPRSSSRKRKRGP
jgi:PHD/YefM family antitoxin component YafN of YafNO toxin-antitoxin module